MDMAAIEPAEAALIEALSKRYLWWDSPEPAGHSIQRMIAQIMHLGTYDDIRRLEALVAPSGLAEIMRRAAPGWFDDRSWDFWRGRLLASGQTDIPERPPLRSFADAGSH